MDAHERHMFLEPLQAAILRNADDNAEFDSQIDPDDEKSIWMSMPDDTNEDDAHKASQKGAIGDE